MKSKKEIATEALTTKHPNYHAIMKVLQSDTEELYFNGVKEPKITGKLATFKNISKAISNHLKDLDAYDSEERSAEIENLLLEPLPLLSIEEIATLNNLWKNKSIQKISLSYLRETEKPEYEDLINNEEISIPSKDFESVSETEFNETIKDTLSNISMRERNVIKMRYGLNAPKPMTLAEVSEHYGVSPHRIAQIEAKAIKNLRHPTRSYELTEFLDINEADKYDLIDRLNNTGNKKTLADHVEDSLIPDLPSEIVPFDQYFDFPRIDKLANAIVILDNAIKYDCFVYARKLKDIILGIKVEMDAHNYFQSVEMANKKSKEIAAVVNKEIIRIQFEAVKESENAIFRGINSKKDPIEYMACLYSEMESAKKSKCPLYQEFNQKK